MEDDSKQIAALQIQDTLTNLIAGLGTDKDKRAHSSFQYTNVTVGELETMYEYDWLSASIVDIPVNDSMRKWREFQAPSLSDDQLKALTTAEQGLLTRPNFVDCKKWSRLYGGSVILMGLSDSLGKPQDPLEAEKVKQGDLQFLRTIDNQYIQPGQINTTNPFAENYQLPEFYTVNGLPIHHTRLLRFDGRRLPRKMAEKNNYWGVSVLKTAYEQILDARTTPAIVSSLLYESKLDVIHIPELAAQLASPNGSDLLIQRFRLADIVKSINNTLLLDSKETFDRKATNFSGLSQILKDYMLLASAAARIPATRLFGQSAEGLNASGEGQQDDYDDMVQSIQTDELRPQLDKFDQVFLRSELGYVPDDWSYEFPSLRQLTELEQAQVDKTNAERDTLNVNIGAIDPVLVTKDLQDRGTYSSLDDEYVQLIEEMDGTTATGEGVE